MAVLVHRHSASGYLLIDLADISGKPPEGLDLEQKEKDTEEEACLRLKCRSNYCLILPSLGSWCSCRASADAELSPPKPGIIRATHVRMSNSSGGIISKTHTTRFWSEVLSKAWSSDNEGVIAFEEVVLIFQKYRSIAKYNLMGKM